MKTATVASRPAERERPAGGGRSRRRRALPVAASLVLASVTAFVALAVLGPLVLPYRTYVVRTGSMRPSIPVGALAVYRPAAAGDLRPGDVIAFTRPGTAEEIVTHRIASIEQDGAESYFVTKGDANGQPDDWRVPASGTGWRYRFDLPGAGFALAALGSAAGRRLVLVVAVVGGAGFLLARIWRPARSDHPSPSSAPAERREIAPPAAARHDLAGCLSVVLGHAQLLRRTTADDDPRRVDVDAVLEAAVRASRLFPALGAAPLRSGLEPVADPPHRLQAAGPGPRPLDLLPDPPHVLGDRARVLPV